MKAPLLGLAATVLAISALAQGTVNFANSASTLIRYDPTSPVSPGLPVPVGEFTVGLYYAPLSAGLTPSDVPWSAMTLLATTGIAPVAGRFLGGVVTTPATTAPGDDAYFAVRVWSWWWWDGAPPLYRNRTTSIFRNPTGGGGALPTPPAALVGFLGINDVNIVPEPRMLAMGFLGLAVALLLVRRRSQRLY